MHLISHSCRGSELQNHRPLPPKMYRGNLPPLWYLNSAELLAAATEMPWVTILDVCLDLCVDFLELLVILVLSV